MVRYRRVLNEGDIIEVQGYVMLYGLEGGRKYKVLRVLEYNRQPTYQFVTPRGVKVVVTHYAHEVDMWIKDHDNNRIVIIKRK